MLIGDILSKSVHLYALALYKDKVYLLKKLQRENRLQNNEPVFSPEFFPGIFSIISSLYHYPIFIPGKLYICFSN